MEDDMRPFRVNTYGRISTMRQGPLGEPAAWLAFVDGDRRKHDTGRTEEEAIGRCIVTHAGTFAQQPLPRRRRA